MIVVPCSLFSFGGVGLSTSFNIVAWPVSPRTPGTTCELSRRLLPDDGQRDEVHQEGHDGHVRSPVGVIRPQGPALHFAVREFPLPKYDQGGDGEQEGEAPGGHGEDLGLLFCSEKRDAGLGIWKHSLGEYLESKVEKRHRVTGTLGLSEPQFSHPENGECRTCIRGRCKD